MVRGPDVATLLEHALVADAVRHGVTLDVESATLRPWASATFAGARVTLSVQLAASSAAEAWLDGLGEAELPLAGHLVADCTVARTCADGVLHATIEALTVEER